MSARALVFGHGDEICGVGRLVRTGDGDSFGPPLPARAVRYGPDGQPAPKPSRFAVPVVGAQFDEVVRRYERDGCIDGHADITGVWLGDRIRITRQTVDFPHSARPAWTTPPCPAPPGGWPRAGTYSPALSPDLSDLKDSGAAISVVIFRPSEDDEVLVVTASDVAAVEARLRPQFGDALCVVASRWTRAQLDEGAEHLRQMADQWRIYAWGTRIDEQAQATVHAALVRVTEDVATWADSLPDGLVTLEPWLRPAKS